MAGKFLQRPAIIDSLAAERAANACRRRDGLTRHPVRGYSCGCPDPGCGAFYVIDTSRVVPTPAECRALLTAHNRVRKAGRGAAQLAGRYMGDTGGCPPHWFPFGKRPIL